VTAKFVENEFEKADRLMELFFLYQSRFQAALDRLKQREDVDDADVDSTLRDAGSFMLQQVSRIDLICWLRQSVCSTSGMCTYEEIGANSDVE
jgi:hypothetical protein